MLRLSFYVPPTPAATVVVDFLVPEPPLPALAGTGSPQPYDATPNLVLLVGKVVGLLVRVAVPSVEVVRVSLLLANTGHPPLEHQGEVEAVVRLEIHGEHLAKLSVFSASSLPSPFPDGQVLAFVIS